MSVGIGCFWKVKCGNESEWIENIWSKSKSVVFSPWSQLHWARLQSLSHSVLCDLIYVIDSSESQLKVYGSTTADLYQQKEPGEKLISCKSSPFVAIIAHLCLSEAATSQSAADDNANKLHGSLFTEWETLWWHDRHVVAVERTKTETPLRHRWQLRRRCTSTS